jgi:hypothetical protein
MRIVLGTIAAAPLLSAISAPAKAAGDKSDLIPARMKKACGGVPGTG